MASMVLPPARIIKQAATLDATVIGALLLALIANLVNSTFFSNLGRNKSINTPNFVGVRRYSATKDPALYAKFKRWFAS